MYIEKVKGTCIEGCSCDTLTVQVLFGDDLESMRILTDSGLALLASAITFDPNIASNELCEFLFIQATQDSFGDFPACSITFGL